MKISHAVWSGASIEGGAEVQESKDSTKSRLGNQGRLLRGGDPELSLVDEVDP